MDRVSWDAAMAQGLSALDAAYLHQESATNPMTNSGVCLLDTSTRPGGLSFDDVGRVFEQRLATLPRLRQRVVEVPFGAGRPVWADDPQFDLRWHLRRAVLAPPGNVVQLRELVEHLHPRRLERSRPLWEVYVVEGLDGGRLALVMRFHHALADGMSAMFLAGTLLDGEAGPAGPSPPWSPEPTPSAGELFAQALAQQLDAPRRIGAAAREAVVDPERARDTAGRLRRATASLPTPDTFREGPFNVAVGTERRVGWATVPSASLRRIRRAARAPMRDVVLAIVGASLGHLLASRGLDAPTLRVLVPVSDLAAVQRGDFGNQGSCEIIDLPTAPMEPLTRVRSVAARTARARETDQRIIARLLRGAWEALPASVDPLVIAAGESQPDYVNLVVSYMRGTRRTLAFDGARHLATVPVPPLAPKLALTVAVVYLGDVVSFGVTGDWAAVPDLEKVPEGVFAAIAAFEQAVAS